MWTIYHFEITDENSDLAGEEFLTELQDASKEEHIAYAKSIFPNVELTCCGRRSEYEAEALGLDTY